MRGCVISPTEGLIYDYTFGLIGCAVPVIFGQVRLGVSDCIAEESLMPGQNAGNGLGVRITEELGRIEAQAFSGLIGSVYPVAVKLVGPHLRKVYMPDLISLLFYRETNFTASVQAIEKAQFHSRGVLRKESKVNT